MVLLDRPLWTAHVSIYFVPAHFSQRLSTDILETFPHDMALVEKSLLCQFPESAPNKIKGRKTQFSLTSHVTATY